MNLAQINEKNQNFSSEFFRFASPYFPKYDGYRPKYDENIVLQPCIYTLYVIEASMHLNPE